MQVKDFDQPSFDAWLAERPSAIKEMVRSHPPDRLYRIESGHRATIYSYHEDGTVTVDVTGMFNRVLFSRRVFGIPLETLVECDLPSSDEDVGDIAAEAGYTDDDVLNIIIPEIRKDMEGRNGT